MRYLGLVALLFVVASVADYVMTWWFVVRTGGFVELNPFIRDLISRYPPWVWLLRDLACFTVVVLSSLAFRWFVLKVSVREPPAVRDRLESIAGKYWVIPLTIAVFRLLPAIHDVLTVAGYETPLPHILFWWAMSPNP